MSETLPTPIEEVEFPLPDPNITFLGEKARITKRGLLPWVSARIPLLRSDFESICEALLDKHLSIAGFTELMVDLQIVFKAATKRNAKILLEEEDGSISRIGFGARRPENVLSIKKRGDRFPTQPFTDRVQLVDYPIKIVELNNENS